MNNQSYTMKQVFARTVYIFFFLLCLMACKKDGNQPDGEDDQKTETPVNGGTIIRYSMITIGVGDITLNKEEYLGKIGDITIPLLKSEDNELTFIPMENIPDGEQELLIPELNNFRIAYTVKDPVLTGSANETIAPLFNTFVNFAEDMADGMTNALLLHNLRHIAEIYENATAEQQRIMAMSYQANKSMFDAVFAELNDIQQSSRVQRQSPVTRIGLSAALARTNHVAGIGRDIKDFVNHGLFNKFARCIIVMGGSAYLSVKTATATAVLAGVTVGASGLVSAALLGLAVVMAIEAIKTLDEIMEGTLTRIWLGFLEFLNLSSNVRQTSGTSLSGGLKASGAGSSGELVLYHDVTEIVPLYVTGSKLQQSDRDNPSAVLQAFFTGFDKLVSMKETINEGLAWCNENVPFANFNLLPIETIPADSEEQEIDTPSDILDHLSFSIDHANLQLVSVSLTEVGELSIKVNIVNSQEESIKSELKYTYKDDFNSFEETVPIEVKVEEEIHFELTGVWQIIHYDDDTRTTTATTQITEIDFQNGGLGYTIRRYNDGWGNVEDPYNLNGRYTDPWDQSFNSSSSILSLVPWYYNVLYRFTYDPQKPNILIGESIGASNNGFDKELVKQ